MAQVHPGAATALEHGDVPGSVSLPQGNSWGKRARSNPMARANHGSHTPGKFQSNGSPGGNEERQEQISRARRGKDPRGAARMLSGTSDLSSPHQWVLSWVPANAETLPDSGQGELFMLTVSKQMGAGSDPWEPEPCCCSISLLTRGTPMTLPHQEEGQTDDSLRVPPRGIPHWSRCQNPSEGRPKLWSL